MNLWIDRNRFEVKMKSEWNWFHVRNVSLYGQRNLHIKSWSPSSQEDRKSNAYQDDHVYGVCRSWKPTKVKVKREYACTTIQVRQWFKFLGYPKPNKPAVQSQSVESIMKSILTIFEKSRRGVLPSKKISQGKDGLCMHNYSSRTMIQFLGMPHAKRVCSQYSLWRQPTSSQYSPFVK